MTTPTTPPTAPKSRLLSISSGFILGGLANIVGILIFSLGFSNELMSELSPIICSRFGIICIILWGLAYIAVSGGYRHVPLLVCVFALEKLVYVVSWILWISEHGSELPGIFSRSPLTAAFFALYGPNDLAFGLFFTYVAVKCWGLAPDLAPTPTDSDL